MCLVIPGRLNDIAWFNLSFQSLFYGTTSNPNAYVSALIGAFWAYSGYHSTGIIVEEIKEPLGRNLWFAGVISMLTVTAVYILTNVSYFLLLSPIEMLATDAVAITFGTKFSIVFAYVIKAFVCLSTFGTININLINGSRETLAASRNQHLPRQLSLINIKR